MPLAVSRTSPTPPTSHTATLVNSKREHERAVGGSGTWRGLAGSATEGALGPLGGASTQYAKHFYSSEYQRIGDGVGAGVSGWPVR
eukprot:CAMPEP_0173112972 /NCGR_PEP_ID=MMETSP1102-20130122/46473_1 /TAXON_ID=49646 /ORGANISM="Geminigera sp., Strain Caron Lab Isolate" /LENGTH=85 /DNA_ID=CAMNT_0014014419 /DNA_START=79 /DNA_END=336 /DNA_ORIENTATION=-